MKTLLTVTVLSLCSLSSGFAEEADAKPPADPGKAPWNKPLPAGEPQIVRPIGRIEREEAKPQTEAIPKQYADHKEVAIVLEDLKQIGERLAMQVTLRIINPTDKPFTFTGFSEQSPILKVQHMKAGKWVDEPRVLRCGTGLRQCTIAPGQSAVFYEAVYSETMPTRFGISHTVEGANEPQVVWSEKIER